MIAFITVSAGFGFARNSQFQRDFSFGFNQNNIIGVQLPKENYTAYRDAVSKISSIDVTAGSVGHLFFSWRNVAMEANGIKKEIKYLMVGENYFNVMDVQVLTGRPFRNDNTSDVKKV